MGALFSLADVEAALPIVRASVPATPQYAWPQLQARTGVEVVVKHENHTPTGAFKVRGVVTATRGNHGQSFACAGRQSGVPVAVVVPHGNSIEKNAAMRAFGAELIEHGRDFDAAKERAEQIATERGYEYGPSLHRDLIIGVASYALEMFTAAPDLDTVYVPIGLGSGICAMIGMRDALGLKTKVVGVVAQRANAYRLSFDAGAVVTTNSALTFADGMAVRVPDKQALEIIRRGADRIVEVEEDEIAETTRVLFSDTHTLAESARAGALAALIKEREWLQGRRVAVVVTGQNIDRSVMRTVLDGGTPEVG